MLDSGDFSTSDRVREEYLELVRGDEQSLHDSEEITEEVAYEPSPDVKDSCKSLVEALDALATFEV